MFALGTIINTLVIAWQVARVLVWPFTERTASVWANLGQRRCYFIFRDFRNADRSFKSGKWSTGYPEHHALCTQSGFRYFLRRSASYRRLVWALGDLAPRKVRKRSRFTVFRCFSHGISDCLYRCYGHYRLYPRRLDGRLYPPRH